MSATTDDSTVEIHAIESRLQSIGRPREETRLLGDLAFRHDLQVRALPKTGGAIAVDEPTAQRYTQLYKEGADLGPLVVLDTTDVTGLVVDGFHRGHALRTLYGTQWRTTPVTVMVFDGTEDDARMLACELNSARGLQFTGPDWLKIAEVYLGTLFRQGTNPSDNSVARILGVTRYYVAEARKRLEPHFPDLPTTRISNRRKDDGTPVQRPPTYTTKPLTGFDRDDDDAFQQAPAGAPPRQPLSRAPRSGSPTDSPRHHGSASRAGLLSGGHARPTVIDEVIRQRIADWDLPEPVIQQGDPIAITLRWTMVDEHGEPSDGAAMSAMDFQLIPPAVRHRLRALLEAVDAD